MLKNGNITLIGEIRGLKPQRRTDDPQAADLKEGLMWVNSTEKALKWYDGAEILTIATGGALDDYLSKEGGTLTGPLVLAGNAEEELQAVPLRQVTSLLEGKQNTIEGAASTIVATDLTASRAVASDANGKVIVSATTSEELGYLSGVTSGIQEQLDDKQANLGFTPVNKAGDSVTGDLNFGGTHTLKNLSAPVDDTDPVRRIDLDRLQAGLDFQSDVLAIQLDDTLVPTTDELPDNEIRYIVTVAADLNEAFGEIEGLGDGDIIQKSGENFVIAYDVSERGPGALAWDRGTSRFMKWDGANWSQHGGLSGVTVSAGLRKEGNTLSVNFGAGVTNLPTGEIGLDLDEEGGLVLLDPVSGEASTGADSVLSLKIAAASALVLSATGVTVKQQGVTPAHLSTGVAGLGLAGGAGDALTLKLDGSSLVVSADGVKVGDISATYLKLDKTSEITAQVTVPAPTADGSIANLKTVNDAVAVVAEDIDDLGSRLDGNVFVFDGTAGAAQDTYSINHNLGFKYANVAVYDEADSQLYPDTVTLNDANNLTVTLAQAQRVRIVICGRKVIV